MGDICLCTYSPAAKFSASINWKLGDCNPPQVAPGKILSRKQTRPSVKIYFHSYVEPRQVAGGPKYRDNSRHFLAALHDVVIADWHAGSRGHLPLTARSSTSHPHRLLRAATKLIVQVESGLSLKIKLKVNSCFCFSPHKNCCSYFVASIYDQ